MTLGRTLRGAACLAALLIGVGGFASNALAQSGAALLVSPWQEGEAFEFDADFYMQGRGRVQDADRESIRINTFEGSGRFRFDRHDRHSPAVGFDAYHLNLRHGVEDLPQRLSDQSLGLGFGIAEWEGWEIGATVGLGFAGDLPYSDGDAWYALGNLIASRQLDERSWLQLGLNYNGNRSLFPDIPLPGFAYTRRVSDDLTYTVGVPQSAVQWRPLDRLTIDAEYALIYHLNLTVAYELVEEAFSVYGGFYNRFNGFHINDDDRNRRVFFQQRRLEAGGIFSRGENWQIVAAGGYAFDQELRRGWDVRDLAAPTEFSNEPYLRLGFEVAF